MCAVICSFVKYVKYIIAPVTNRELIRYISVMSEKNLIITFTEGRNRLLTLARRLLTDSSDVEDALQEAFCRLWQKADTLTSQADSDKVATTTLRNISLDKLRSRQRHPQTTTTEAASGIKDDEDVGVKERYEVVKSLIDQELTEQQQRILKWHDVEGDSYEEIARREQMTEEAVRKQLSRARKTIRDCYRKIDK